MLITLYDQKEIDEMRAESLLKEGEEKKAYEVVKSMLLDGLDFKTISKYTKISESDFKKIQSAM